MLHLNRKELKNTEAWQSVGIKLPNFDVEEMVAATQQRPTWVHFGAGNIFRGFIAALQQRLLNTGKAKTGIIAVETYDTDIIDKIYAPYDNLSLLVLMHLDGSLDQSIIASISEGIVASRPSSDGWERVQQIFQEDSLQMVSFTITEKGYSLTNTSGELLSDVKLDIEQGPAYPRHLIAKVASLAYTRYQAGELPIAFVSMDNCSENGKKLRIAIETIAQSWHDRGLVKDGFLTYLNNGEKVSFPWSMIDKITPRPADDVKHKLSEAGVEGMDIICTDKKTFIAPFVNAEVPQYLVIEDNFPNGRMPLEEAGVYFTDRDTVEKVERMKVTTCLNPLHTALAVFGCVLGYTSIAEEMKDDSLKNLVERIGYDEGMPVVVDSGILDSVAFINEVIEKRLPNPSIPDTPQRIATDTSQKVAIRFGETIKAYCTHPDLDVTTLDYIPLVIAGWFRYLMGVDDNGETFILSPDPMLDKLTQYVRDINLGDTSSYQDNLKLILSNVDLFGVNLYEVGLGPKIEMYFKELISEKHAVERTLKKYLTIPKVER